MDTRFDFDNRFYIITGAASVLGRAVSIMLSDSGAKVLLTDKNEEGLDETSKLLTGDNHLIYAKDLMCDDYTDLFEYAISGGEKISGIVHCAGRETLIPITVLTRSKAEECMSEDLYSFIELMRLYAKKKYRAERGNVVAISSISSIYPDKYQTILAASKAAMNIAVQGVALELAKNNIRINSVVPGSMITEMAMDDLEEENIENIDRKHTRQVFGLTNADDVAKVVMFLLSDLSASITGRTIFADGGYINF